MSGIKQNAVTLIIVLAFLTRAINGFSESESNEMVPAISTALLSERWESVIEYCEELEDISKSPVFRAIKGHACLALNRNDEALGLFLSLCSEHALVAWREWASRFVTENPANHVALYLEGDALARLGEWERAVSAYSKALRINPSFALAFNARGIAYVYLADLHRAQSDLKAACAADSGFADAFASLGAFLVLKEAPEGALENYELALRRSPTFALAKNGRGCARIGYSMDPRSVASALVDFGYASRCASVTELAESNIESVRGIVGGLAVEDTVRSSNGMSLTVRDVFRMDPGLRDNFLNDMSNESLWKMYDDSWQNLNHSRNWAPVRDVLKGFSFDLSGGWQDVGDWQRLHGDVGQELLGRGFDIGEGGATTQELQYEYGDQGKWPVRTWFGLVQQVDAPAWFVTGGREEGRRK